MKRYIGNELDDDYPDGFTKVKSVEKKAGTYNMPTSMPYHGRGIVIGKSADGTKAVIAYFIMGRSENSRNRIL